MPIDINALRTDKGGNPAAVLESEKKRFRDGKMVEKVMELDAEWIKAQFQTDQLRKQSNAVQKQITERKKASKGQDQCTDLVEEKEKIAKTIEEQTKKSDELLAERDAKLHLIGNLVDPTVPVSQDEEKDNEVVADWGAEKRFMIPEGKIRTEGFRPHYELLHMIGAVELDEGVAVAGHRGYFLSGPGVLLNQALINYGLAFLTKKGYRAMQPPFFMKKDVMGMTAELKDYDESLYRIQMSKENPELDMFLIATSEQPISAFHLNKTFEKDDLPKRYAGYSSCFRKEAGSSGRDIRGIFRIHQFEKIEQFTVVQPEESSAEHKAMIAAAEEFYQSLDIPYRVVNIVSGELNDAAAKKFDLEAWFPGDAEGKGQYRELVSCSNCTDYQSRALTCRIGFDKKTQTFPHMLNSTLCATERALCCLVENYQTPEGVKVPEVLKPFMLGMDFIPFVRPPPAERK